MTYLPEVDYFVRTVDLPAEVGGLVAVNEDGTYSVYINAKLSSSRQEKALRHEVDHIENDDFYNGKPIEEVEKKRAS